LTDGLNPDLSSEFPYDDMVKNLDGTGVINRVEVVGGLYLSEDTTLYIPGTGQTNIASLPHFIHEANGLSQIQVWRNDGTQASPIWVEMTVTISYQQAISGNIVLFDYNNRSLTQQNAWPNFTNAIKVFCRYEVPLRARYVNNPSYSFYGRYFDGLIVSADITDKISAQVAAQGLLIKSALGSVALACVVHQPGLRAGMTIRVNNAKLGITDTDFTIQRLSGQFTTGGYVTFSLELGFYRITLVDLFMKTARLAKTPPPWRDNEVLDEIISFDESMAPISEVSNSVTALGPTYKWGVSSPTAYWGFGKWG
jgi:hypothetical protein